MTEEKFNYLVEKYGRELAEEMEKEVNKGNQGIAELINAGTREKAGEFKSTFEAQKRATSEDSQSIANLINQGTRDVLENPGKSSEKALRDGALLREINESLEK